MTLQDIQKRNEHFQERIPALVDLIPGVRLLDISPALIRSTRLIDKYIVRVVQATNEDHFQQAMSLIEEEMDEAVYILDRMDMKNQKYKLKVLENFLKEGYNLLSIYSLCCDHIISKRMSKDEELL